MSNGPKVINSINKAIDILELLHADDDGFTVSEISAALDLGVSSTYHILNTMKIRGFIDQDKRTKRYSLGKGIYSLCYQKTPKTIIDIAMPYLKRLTSALGETSNLVLLQDTEIEYVAQMECDKLIRMSAQLGSRAPFYCTAGGKAIFAFKPYEEQKAALEAITLQPYTAHTIIVKKALRDDLEHIRDKQIAYDMEEKEIGVICAAAPVLGANNTAIAAISLSGPSFRMTEQNLITVSEELKKAAKELGKELASL